MPEWTRKKELAMVSDVLDGRFEKEGVCVKENLLRPLGLCRSYDRALPCFAPRWDGRDIKLVSALPAVLERVITYGRAANRNP